MNRRLALFATLGLTTLGILTQATDASADRFRFSGGGRVHAQASGGISVQYSRPAYRPYAGRGWGVSGRVYVGPRYNYGYYPRYSYYPRTYYYYQPVPSYYGVYSEPQSYYPVQPAAQPAAQVAIVAPARPELPRFGIGLFAGGASVEGTDGGSTKDSSDVGLLGRFRLSQGLLVEGEIGKTSYQNDLRVDRRLGASLIYEIGAYNKLAPYVLAGLGVQQAEVGQNGEFQTRQNFGEIGVGLRYALSPRLHILFDVRAGSRATATSDAMPQTDVATRTIAPPSATSNNNESYTRGRFAAVLNF